MTRRVPWLTLRTTRKTTGRLRVETLEDRTVPSFTVAKSFPVGPGTGIKPVSVAVGDFDGDGRLDAATANQDSHNLVSILRGNGDGTFSTSADINIGRQPGFIQAADLNADGRLDLVTANKTDNSVTALLGNGDGTFQSPATFPVGTGTSPAGLAVADLDGDGKLDLAVADSGANSVTLMFGDGAGGFVASAQTISVGTGAISVAAADFNGDGRPDLAAIAGGSAPLKVILNTGGGTFGPATGFATGFSANALTTGDFNHDGKADVAVACVFPSSDGVSVLLGIGDGTFVTYPNPPGPAVPYRNYNAGNQTPGYITTADLDGDGNLDLVTANYSSTGQFANNSVSLLPGRADGTFGPARVYYGGPAPMGVAVGDLNGDGHPDLVTADSGGSGGTVSVLLGRGDGTMKAAEGLAVTVRNAASATGVAAGDFTGDGKTDLAVVTWNVNYNGITLFPGLGTGEFAPGIQSPAVSATSIAAGDFNGDGKLDLAVTGDSGVSILLGNGNGTFGAPTAYPAGTLLAWVATGDFNGDGKTDLAVANNSGSDGVSVLLGTGTGAFGPATSVPAGGAASYLTVADLNGDSKADLAVVSASKVSVVLGNGNGTFQAPTSYDAGTPGSVSVGDFDGDGDPDLVATSFIPPGGGGSAVLVWRNDGAGGFGGMTKYLTDSFGSNPIGSAVADLDQDGVLDIVAVNDFSDTLSLFTGTGTGSFNAQTTFTVGDRPTWVTAADFTGDGRLDLAVVNSNSGSVTIIHTPKPATHVRFDAVPAATAGATFHVTVTALDEDGNQVPDYIGTVHFGSDDAQAVLPADYQFTLADAGSHTFDVTLSTAGARTVSLTTQFGTLTAPVQVDAATADHLEFGVPAAATAGAAFDVTVRVFDEFGNPATGFRGTVHFTSTDPNAAAVLPADYAFTDTDAGAHTFSGGFTLLTAGTRTVSVAATGLSPLNAQVSVSPAAASRLTLSAPTAANAGVPINVTVTAFDPYGNRATGFAGTVHFDSTDSIADLPDDYPFTGLDQGTHTFQVTLKRAGAQSVSVSAAGLTGAEQTGIQVSAAAAFSLTFVNRPANTFPNLAIPGGVAVEVRDQFGNPVGGGSPVSLSLASNPTRARLTGVLFAFPDANGLATFPSVLVTKPGTYTLMAAGIAGLSLPSESFTVYAATHFRVKVTSAVPRPTAGDVVTVTVTALDGLNRQDLSYRGTVHFASTDTQAGLPADYTFTDADHGQHSFDVTLRTAGLKVVTVNDKTKVAVRGRLAVAVVAATATHFAVAGFPVSARANRWYAFTVTALDQFGNRATGYLGTVTITSTGSATIGGAGPAAPAPVTYTFKPLERGRHAFTAKFTAAGTGQSLTATDQADATVTGSETGITVV